MVEGFGRVLLFGASGGIGSALATALSGNDVTTLSRSRNGFDLTHENSVAEAAKRMNGPFDLIIDATGALQIDGAGPEKAFDCGSAPSDAPYRLRTVTPMHRLQGAGFPEEVRSDWGSRLDAWLGSLGRPIHIHADNAPRQLVENLRQREAPYLQTQSALTRVVKANEGEGVLADVDADYRKMVRSSCRFSGMLLLLDTSSPGKANPGGEAAGTSH